jgi:hypothetical protein
MRKWDKVDKKELVNVVWGKRRKRSGERGLGVC